MVTLIVAKVASAVGVSPALRQARAATGPAVANPGTMVAGPYIGRGLPPHSLLAHALWRTFRRCCWQVLLSPPAVLSSSHMDNVLKQVMLTTCCATRACKPIHIVAVLVKQMVYLPNAPPTKKMAQKASPKRDHVRPRPGNVMR